MICDKSFSATRAVLALIVMALSHSDARCEDFLRKPQRIEDAQDARYVTSDVTVSIVTSKDQFQPLEPITLIVTARNTTEGHGWIPPAGYFPEGLYRVFHVLVYDRKGNLLPRTRYGDLDVRYRGLEIGSSMGGMGCDFAPGSQIRGELVANLVYDMTSPGLYTVLVEVPTASYTEVDGFKRRIYAQSKPIKVLVVADPPRIPDLSDSKPEGKSQ